MATTSYEEICPNAVWPEYQHHKKKPTSATNVKPVRQEMAGKKREHRVVPKLCAVLMQVYEHYGIENTVASPLTRRQTFCFRETAPALCHLQLIEEGTWQRLDHLEKCSSSLQKLPHRNNETGAQKFARYMQTKSGPWMSWKKGKVAPAEIFLLSEWTKKHPMQEEVRRRLSLHAPWGANHSETIWTQRTRRGLRALGVPPPIIMSTHMPGVQLIVISQTMPKLACVCV